MPKNVALVLSGGGAKGAFQFGAIKYIEEVVKRNFPAFDYSIIAGVSVGALNGGMMAMGKYVELQQVWNSVSNNSIYTGDSWPAIVWRLIRGKKSVFSNAPLADRIRRYFRLADIKATYDYRIGLVSLRSGRYVMLRPPDFSRDSEFQNAVLASTAMPIIWEPVEKIILKNNVSIPDSVDGGLRNISPLGDVLDANPSHIIIINCSPSVLEERPDASSGIIEIAKRSLTDITLNEIFNSDVDEFLKINRLVEQAKRQDATLTKEDGEPYKVFRYIKIAPSADLGDSLDFSQASIQSRMRQGYAQAEAGFAGFTFP